MISVDNENKYKSLIICSFISLNVIILDIHQDYFDLFLIHIDRFVFVEIIYKCE